MLQPQTSLKAFLQELFMRFKTKSPKFFQIIQWISASLVMITTLPTLLDEIEAFGITFPDIVYSHVTIAVRYASIGIFLISMLTTQSKPAGVTEDGTVLKKTDETKLPFTAGDEIKKAEKAANEGTVTQLTTKQ
jgi:hypothetical protein